MRYKILWSQFGVEDSKITRFAILWLTERSRRRSSTTSIHPTADKWNSRKLKVAKHMHRLDNRVDKAPNSSTMQLANYGLGG
jgi:hypothetical protein